MAGRRPGESSDELTEPGPASPFDPTALASDPAQTDGLKGLAVAPLSTAKPLPPPPSVNVTAVSEPSAASAPAEIELIKGEVLGDYVIDSKIGRGGMGDVYLGVHPLIKKRAAIKLLRGEHCRDESAVARFMAEARVVNEIGHPNIVDVFAFGQTTDGRHYLVMEWLQGESLRQRLARGALDVEQTTEIVRPLIRALMAAHAKGVVHRDLKPDNVFLHTIPGEPSTVKLLDFGIAKLSRPDAQMQQTISGVFVGTPMYIAPEQARGLGVDQRADIYTLGGMLFEMVTGRPPFIAATTYEIVAKHLMEPAVRPSTLVPLPRELDDLIFAMLAKEPPQRPKLAEVLRVIESLGDLAQRPTSPLDSQGRESVASIAVTARRPALSSEPGVAASRPFPRWLIPVFLVVAALVAFVVVQKLVRTPEPASDRAPVAAPVAAPVTTEPIAPAPAPAPAQAAVPTPTPAPATDPAPTAGKKNAPKVTTKRTIPKTTKTTTTSTPLPTNPDSDDEKLIKRGSLK